MALLLSAVGPVVKVVMTIVLLGALPLESTLGLVNHTDALLELSVMVSAAIAILQRNLQSIKFFIFMGLWLEGVNGHCTRQERKS